MMKLLNLFAFAILFSNCAPTLVPIKKICKDCRHFIGDNAECRRYSDTNIINGKITYESARTVRGDNTKCGEDAMYFEENNFKIVTVPYYFLKDKWLIFLPFGALSLYYCAILYVFNE